MVETQPRRLEDFGKLTQAEQQVLAELDTGEDIRLGDGELPSEDAGEDRQLRACFVRWLALGGDDDHRLHEKGLRVAGALITSDGPAGVETPGLDLARDLVFFNCRFADPPLLRSARLEGLFLDGSILPGLIADRLQTRGGVHLRRAEVTGEVRLASAQIGGNLDCADAKITNAGGTALDADNAKVTNAVHRALNADSAKVTGTFFLRKGAKIDGLLDLTGAELGAIADDPACWPEKTGNLALNRCRYGAFTGQGVTASDRIRWLALQEPAKFKQNFWPQPYEQCAKVFREMGHLADAKDILIEKEKLQRAARRKRIGNRLVRAATWLADGFLALTVRYGQRPLTALWWLGGLWAIGVLVFSLTWQADAFKPNNAFVLRAPEWVGCSVNAQPYAFRKDTATASQLGCFLAQPEAEGFPTFNAWVYAFDVLFPLVEVEQQVHWVPDEDIRPIGRLAKWLVYIEIVAGWLLSLLAVAGLSGIIKSD
jgi:hypothetical protein